MMAMNTAPGQRDPVDRLGQVGLGLRAGTHAGDEPALAADLVGLAHRIEGDRVVEVGEGDDQHREHRDVHDVLAVEDVLVDVLLRSRRAVPPAVAGGRCPRKLAMIAGSNRIELAKMIGITPDWLTFNGM